MEERRQKLAEIRIGDTEKNQTKFASSTPSSPVGLRKSASGRQRCLCSPTTHVGSFRCRYHRSNSGLKRSGNSIGSKLSDLASLGQKLSVLSLAELGKVDE